MKSFFVMFWLMKNRLIVHFMKKKILAAIAAILNFSGLIRLFLLFKHLFSSRKLIILCYHRICNTDESFMLDEGVVSTTPGEFETQMKFVSKHFNVITFRRLAEYRKMGRFPKNALIITFDDGYRDNYTTAYPVLRKYGLSATIFLTTGYIETSKLFWWDKVAYIIKKTGEREAELSVNGAIYRFGLSSLEHEKKTILEIIKILKSLKKEEQSHILHQMGKQLNVNIDGSAGEGVLLTWKEIREMSCNGIEFGSHSVNHPIFSTISYTEMENELISSRKEIEKNISLSPVAFAYPDGYYDMLTKKAMKRSGFQYAVTLIKGINDSLTDPYELKRIPIGTNITMNLFMAYLVFLRFMSKTLDLITIRAR
jgi:peptidoglycan/xylan/chitin deacetylase (PgdA/CDA1 family)